MIFNLIETSFQNKPKMLAVNMISSYYFYYDKVVDSLQILFKLRVFAILK